MLRATKRSRAPRTQKRQVWQGWGPAKPGTEKQAPQRNWPKSEGHRRCEDQKRGPWPCREMLSKAPGIRGTRLGRGGKNTDKSLLCDGCLVAVACGSLAEQFGKLWHSDIVRARSCPFLHLMCTFLCTCVFSPAGAAPDIFQCHIWSDW